MARLRSAEKRGVSKRVQVAFGRRLRQKRKGRLNQNKLAEALEVTRTTISNIERGQHRIFLDQAYLAARALDVPLAELLPTIDDVWPLLQLVLEVQSEVEKASIVRATEIASSIQQRAVPDERPRSSRRKTAKKGA